MDETSSLVTNFIYCKVFWKKKEFGPQSQRANHPPTNIIQTVNLK